MTIVTMLTCGITLLLIGTTFVVTDFLQLRQSFQRELSTTGTIVGAAGGRTLLHRDREEANQALRALRSDKRIAMAVLYLSDDNKPLASYYRQGTLPGSLPAIRRPGMYQEAHSILLIQSVVLNSEVIGQLAIRADISDLTSLLVRDLSMATLVMLACTLIAFLCTLRLQRIITRPIGSLVDTVGRIPWDDVHTPRQPGTSDDEVDILRDAFGMMRSHVERLEVALREYQAVMQDKFSELESSHAELIVAKSRAEEADGFKSRLLANLRHEVRMPLNGVIGMTQMALETGLTPEQSNYVTSVSNAAESLLKVINDSIELYGIEAGGLTLGRQEFSISETLYEVLRMFSPAARQKGLALLLDIHNDVPSTVFGDRVKFRQVMANLVDNALKFTDDGKVTVEVSSVFHSDSIVRLHLKVRDTGRGLAKDQFERAVEPFQQAHDSNTRMIGGTGLGLAISNRLICMMEGRLWLDSELGAGSTLHVLATFGTSNTPAAPPLDLNDLRGVSVLVADGSAITRRILQQLLSRWQMRPTLAASGPEATEIMRSATAAGNPFDIALVDRHMLGIDGSQLAKEVREHSKLGIPVITVLSSMTAVSVTDLTREIRPSSYLVKPVSHSMLLKAVSDSMHTVRDQRNEITSVGLEVTGKKAHILVAEDNTLNQAVAVSILTKEGYEVTVVENGTQAVEAYDRGGFDLILMDVGMPGMSGLDASRVIRHKEVESGGHVVILALTAHALTGDREQCLEAGMDDYVSKPIQVAVLRKTVRWWLSCRSNPSTDLNTHRRCRRVWSKFLAHKLTRF